MKKSLLLIAGMFALTAAAQETTTEPAFVAEALDGKTITLQCASGSGQTTNGYFMIINGTALSAAADHGTHPYKWLVEYDPEEQGMILSSGGYYIGRVPNSAKDADSKYFTLTQNKELAGRYRLYPNNDITSDDIQRYCLTATKFVNGTTIETISKFGGGIDDTANHWMQCDVNGNSAHITRWGSGANNSKWTYSVVEPYEPITVTVNATTGAFAGTGTYHNSYTSTAEDGITITCLASNMKFDGSDLMAYSGTAETSTYTIAPKNPDYYVSAFSFSAQALNGSQTLSIMGGTATAVSTTEAATFSANTIAEGTNATFVLADDNQGIRLTNFTVTIRPRIFPREDGWYTVKAHQINGTAVSKHVICAKEEYRQNASSFYALKIVDAIPEDMPATQYIRIEMVDASHMHVFCPNGHGVNQNGTSAKETPNNTSLTATDLNNGHFNIGGYWSYYSNNGPESPYMGQSRESQNPNNKYTMTKVNPEETYDIWTVTVTGAAATTELKDNARVALNHAENKGLKKVYNHGKFFVTRGTVLAPSDFAADQFDSNTKPLFTVNNEAKTVTVDYAMTQSSKTECLRMAHAKIDELYAPYKAQCIYADGIVDAAIEAAKAKITAAAGDGADADPVSDDTFRAVADAVTAASAALTADVATFNNSIVLGTLVHLNNDRSGTYLRRLTVAADGTLQTLPKNNSLNEIWVIASSDGQGHISLQNYETGLYVNSASNNSATWTTVATPDATHGFFTVTPRKNGTQYPVDFIDQGGNNRHMHAKTNHHVIGYEPEDATSHASAWLISLAEAPEVAEVIESEPSFVNIHKISFTHPDGLSLRSDIEYRDCHNIIVTKIVAPAEAEMPQSRTVADNAFEPILISPTSLTECENGYTAELNTQLDEGDYEVKVPAAIFLVGSDPATAKVSKGYSSTFVVDSDGNTTGINEVTAAGNAADAIYDLQGRRLSAPARGINIINGKKILVK